MVPLCCATILWDQLSAIQKSYRDQFVMARRDICIKNPSSTICGAKTQIWVQCMRQIKKHLEKVTNMRPEKKPHGIQSIEDKLEDGFANCFCSGTIKKWSFHFDQTNSISLGESSQSIGWPIVLLTFNWKKSPVCCSSLERGWRNGRREMPLNGLWFPPPLPLVSFLHPLHLRQ